VLPELTVRRGLVGDAFAGPEQHDASEFLVFLLSKLRDIEFQAHRYGTWGHVQIDGAFATHVERLFSSVFETRRRCNTCTKFRVWYSTGYTWQVTASVIAGGVQTLAEAYLASCGPGIESLFFPGCLRNTEHTVQFRVMTQPNVFILQIPRPAGVKRVPVAVEEQLELPGWSAMDLVGVIYHDGHSPTSGHYTCACRLANGRYALFDDNAPAVPLTDEVGHVHQRLITLAVY